MAQHPITLSEALFTNKKAVPPINILATMFDDVKARDGSLKLAANVFKLASINSEDKENQVIYDKASGVLGMTRRLIRFARWVPFSANLTKNIFASDTIMIIVKAIHHIACIVGCLCEDITTLDKLKLTTWNVSTFENLQKYATFTEASSGVVLCSLLLKQEQVRLRDLLRGLKNNPNIDKKDIYKAFIALHLHQMNGIKWVCEVIAQSFGLNLHSQQQLSIIAAILSSSNGLYCAMLRHLQEQQAK